ncbi:MAG: hypothetical protein JSW71_08295, partial [Gemmatimonadota bacterium]
MIGAGILAYWNSFDGEFVFDDQADIVANEHIRQLWPAWNILSHGHRPVVAVSLAVNYALGGLNVWSYHAFNLAVHILAGLTLFGIVRRTTLGLQRGLPMSEIPPPPL